MGISKGNKIHRTSHHRAGAQAAGSEREVEAAGKETKEELEPR